MGLGIEEAKALVQYGTPAQQRSLLAYIAAEGNLHAAARELKMNRSTVREALAAAVKRAAARGYAPDYGWNPPAPRTETANVAPPGFEFEKVTDNVGPDGARLQAWNKLRRERGQAEPPPPEFAMRRFSQATVGDREVMTWRTFEPDKAQKFEALEKAIRESAAEYVRPLAPITEPRAYDGSLQVVVPIGDPHIGMLAHASETGEDHDLKIVSADLRSAADRLFARLPAAKSCVLLPLGDNFHADDDLQRTPAHHHKLDVDSRAHKVARVGIDLFRYMIDRALLKFEEVTFRMIAGNHDPLSSMWLRFALEGWYSEEPRVDLCQDVGAVQAWRFGRNMCATAHGDGVKPHDLPGTMATRWPEMWGATRFRYGFEGHKHKFEQLEKHGVLVRVMRTLAGKDSFAAKYGHDSGRSLMGFVLHEEFGEIENYTIDITLARSEFDLAVAA